jgi:hypothetical protein
MGWERQTKRIHTCSRPDAWQTYRKRAETGDIWTCRKCKTRWELTFKGIPSKGRAGPLHENTWRRRGSEDYEAVFGTPDTDADYDLMLPPSRKTGTGWLYTVPEKDL